MSENNEVKQWKGAQGQMIRRELVGAPWDIKLARYIVNKGDEEIEVLGRNEGDQFYVWFMAEAPLGIVIGEVAVYATWAREMDKITGEWLGPWKQITEQHYENTNKYQLVKPSLEISKIAEAVFEGIADQMRANEALWELVAFEEIIQERRKNTSSGARIIAQREFNKIIKQHPSIRAKLMLHEEKWVREKLIKWIVGDVARSRPSQRV